MEITGAMIKELRETSGAGMVACKNALTEANGNMEEAVKLLRERGLTQAAKKAGRVAAEGLVTALIEGNKGVVVEVNSETDFAAKSDIFKDFVAQVAKQALNSSAADMAAFMAEKWTFEADMTVSDALVQKIAVISENLQIRRFEKYEVAGDGVLVSYIHGGGTVAVLLYLTCNKVSDLVIEAGKNVCMQIAAMTPKFVSRADVSEAFINEEREILRQAAINEGKNEKIVDKVVEGRLTKELKEYCLLDQEYVKDSNFTVEKYLESVSKENGCTDCVIGVKKFVRYKTGEGIEKQAVDFAEEVNKAING